MKAFIMKTASVALQLLAFVSIHAQNRLTESTNLMRDSDSITMQGMEYSWAGDAGENVIWDFSGVEAQNVRHPIIIGKDTAGNLQRIEERKVCTFTEKSDMLKILKMENRLEHVNYDTPMLSMRYPFQYGDSISSLFSGHGRYCGDHHTSVKGLVSIHADGCGTLILSEGDTLENVLRVCTITSTSMAMDMDSSSLDISKLKQEIVERYDWYIRGYRYPLYETVQRTSYSNLVPVASMSFAYRLLPDSLNLLSDAQNDSIQRKDSLDESKEASVNKDIIHYTVHIEGGNITLSYTLDHAATVTSLVSDALGIVYRRSRQAGMSGEQQAVHFDCGGLHRGQYVLYINVNGRIYNEKVNI